jgi:predicted dehydrogenase
VRAAVVGCGRIGSELADAPAGMGVQSHAGALRACAGTELVAVCDADPARASRAGERWAVPAYVDPEELLRRERPELVVVATPDATHAELARLVLAAPGVRTVLVEKPLAMAVGEAAAVAALAAREGVTLAVHYPRRTAPAYLALRERIDAGALGELRHVGGLYTGGVLHNGTHWFDLVRMLAGEVATVAATDALGEGGADPTLDLHLELADRTTGTLVALPARDHATFELELVGADGRVRVTELGWRIELDAAGPSARFAGYRELRRTWEAVDALQDGVLHAVEDLVGAAAEGRAPRADGPGAVRALAVAEAALRSAAGDGGPVAVPAP